MRVTHSPPRTASAGRPIGATQRANRPPGLPAIAMATASPAFIPPRHPVAHASVVVVDPDMTAAGFIGRALAREPGIALKGAFATAHEAMKALDWRSVDVLLTEMDLPAASALDLMAEALRVNPALRALPLTSNASPTLLFRAIAAGAVGYLLKEQDEAALSMAVLAVVQGGSPISPRMARHLIQRASSTGSRPVQDDLSQRENEIRDLIAKGLQRKEVARALGVSVHTIHAHMRSIHAKLRATNPVAAVRRGARGAPSLPQQGGFGIH